MRRGCLIPKQKCFHIAYYVRKMISHRLSISKKRRFRRRLLGSAGFGKVSKKRSSTEQMRLRQCTNCEIRSVGTLDDRDAEVERPEFRIGRLQKFRYDVPTQFKHWYSPVTETAVMFALKD